MIISSILNIVESEQSAYAAKRDKENSDDNPEEKDLEGLLEKYAEGALKGPENEGAGPSEKEGG